MKNRIAVITVVTALSTLAAAPLLLAHPHRTMGGPGVDFRPGARGAHGPRPGAGLLGQLGRFRAELGLSEEQSARIRTIIAETHEQNVPYREELRKRRRAVAEALLKNPADVAGAQALIDERVEAQRRAQTNRLNATSKALAVLSAGQREKLSAMLAERAERRGRRR
jgi:Spy/CpxP family protein refolding chaperone